MFSVFCIDFGVSLYSCSEIWKFQENKRFLNKPVLWIEAFRLLCICKRHKVFLSEWSLCSLIPEHGIAYTVKVCVTQVVANTLPQGFPSLGAGAVWDCLWEQTALLRGRPTLPPFMNCSGPSSKTFLGLFFCLTQYLLFSLIYLRVAQPWPSREQKMLPWWFLSGFTLYSDPFRKSGVALSRPCPSFKVLYL